MWVSLKSCWQSWVQIRQRNDFRPGAMSGCVSEVKKKKVFYYLYIQYWCMFETTSAMQ